MDQEKPQVGRSILYTVLAYAAYNISYIAVGTVVIIILAFLMQVPVIKDLLGALFKVRGDSPEILAAVVSALLAYKATVWVVRRVCSIKATRNLTFKISGVLFVVLAVITVLAQIINKGSLLSGIMSGIVGVLLLTKGNDDL